MEVATKTIENEEVKYETKEIEEEHELGILVQEENASNRISKPINIPIGFKRKVKIDNKDVDAFLSIEIPGDIDPDLWYPSVEWRITQETLDDADAWPQWLRNPVLINGQPVMQEGREILIQYYVIRSTMDMTEEEDGFFFFDLPFSRDEVKEASDIKLPMIKGSDIISLEEAKKLLGSLSNSGASRRRAE